MKIRTSLVLACFALSVVPLGVIVTYSYFSSRGALRSAYQAEGARLTAQMDRRLSTIREELEQRLAEVSALPRLSEGNVWAAMGDVAPLVESVEIQPMHPAPTPKPQRMVIKIPPIKVPRVVMTNQQRAELKKMRELGRRMGDPTLTAEQRSQLQAQLNETQAAFSESMKLLNERVQAAVEKNRAAHEQAAERMREAHDAMVIGQRFDVPLTEAGEVVGRLEANVNTDRVIRRVLDAAHDDTDRNEITFAVDPDGKVYTRSDAERQALDTLGVPQRIAAGKPLNDIHNWIVALRRDAQSGLQIGVAKPFGEDLEGLRKAAGKNFLYGVVLIFVALIGIVPIANHITGDVEMVTRGAERIAHGDLTTRIPHRSNNEIGHLAMAFNRMAEDLSVQQERIVEQERAAIEYERKSAELEEARRFQLSMLPKEVPRLDGYDIAVFTHTATEVGGDYYDFHVDDGGVAITIGDATGHGARAGTMVAVIKALFAGYSAEQTPAEFLRNATEKVRRMDLGRMAMALLLARFHGRQVTVASAGMPPVYLQRRGANGIEEISLGATPLGTLGDHYRDARVELAHGDTMLFMSDGFPELMNASGHQLGYGAALEAFAAAANAGDAKGVIASLSNAARNWHGDQPPNDDVTFVVVRAV
jgi:serine phosphatase RsbU (regulator of sigma subunit)